MFTTLITALPEQFDSSEVQAMLTAARSACRVHHPVSPLTEDALLNLLQGVDGWIAGGEVITERLLCAAPQLRIIARTGVGVDRVDMEACRRLGIRVTTTPGLTSAAVADLAMALLLCLARQVCLHNRALRSGCWDQSIGIDLQGKVLGIIGLGSIGRMVAQRALAFGMRVVACEPVRDVAFATSHGIAYLDLDDLLVQADVVSLHTPLTSDTLGMMGERELRLMKPTALLINTARGALVDESALVRSLREGWIAGVGLDVFTSEPLVDSPLVDLPNIVLTPHIGAWTEHTWAAMARQAATEVIRALHGESPLNAVV
ncbi:MAG: phosphoglycerate dehydrogenase [Chloroflexi bacterium]|nr:phosphoglycerate dehydrogenase [Chloroflexota bacterium]